MTLFGKRLKQLLILNDYKQIDLTLKLGIPAGTVSAYLNEDMIPRQKRLHQIADFFGVDPGWLAGYSTTAKIKDDKAVHTTDIYNLINESQSKTEIVDRVALLSETDAQKLLVFMRTFLGDNYDE